MLPLEAFVPKFLLPPTHVWAVTKIPTDTYFALYCSQWAFFANLDVISVTQVLSCEMNRIAVYSYLTRYPHGHTGLGRLVTVPLPDTNELVRTFSEQGD